MSRNQEKQRSDIHARVTERIVADLEKGVRPWVQPWSASRSGGPVTRPLRHNGEAYSGMNVLLLWSEALAHGYASPIWMTFRQALELGGHVRKGESGATVVYASRFTRTETDAASSEIERDIPFLKTYSVFNIEQIEKLPDRYYEQSTAVTDPVERIEHAERFFANTGAVIRHGGAQAYYSPVTDHIQMPPRSAFRDATSHVAVLAHEEVHWTARADRAGRDLSRYVKDNADRAMEELIAEIGSALVCADLGIVPELEPRPDHAAYLASWLRFLENDTRAIFRAAAHSQRAVAYLHSLQPADEGREAA
ncbi:MAG: zincin-like metallopeptidase domain-containing protein [Pseudoxanthomonas sp.]